jgi:hypothetical protein
MEMVRRYRVVAVTHVHYNRRKVGLLNGGSRLVGGHSADHDGADLDTVRDDRSIGVRTARRRTEGANDKTKDETDALRHGSPRL